MRSIGFKILQSAALGTHASVSGSVFGRSGKKTLARIGNTDCPIDKHFNFNTCLYGFFNHRKRCLTGQNDSCRTFFLHFSDAVEIMYMHLCGTMYIQIRITCADVMEQSHILNKNAIHIVFIQEIYFFLCIFDFRFIQHRIDCDIDSHISWMTIRNCFLKLFMCEIARKSTCRKARQSHIYCITSACHCSLK